MNKTESNAENRRNILVIGHRKPDTDSICSAIAYADLKTKVDGPWYEPCRAGELNRETKFVLERFGVKPPRVCDDVSAEIQDIDIRPVEGVTGTTSMRKAWEIMRDTEAKTQPIVDENGILLGISTLGDLAKANMDSLDPGALAAANTPFENIISVLEATVICGDPSGVFKRGKTIVGAASPEFMETKVEEGDIVICGNRYESQLCAIELGASLIIVCNGTTVAKTIRKLAIENNCMMVITPYDTFAAASLIRQSVPICAHMTPADKLLKFLPTESVEAAREVMSSVRHRYFPVCSTSGQYMGLISRRNLLNLKRKELILVDHNEKTQCVEGFEDAVILEVIDHHRIGNLQTNDPIIFTNKPVGCTATIIYQMYREHNVEIPAQTAGLLLSAILSDTLAFRSPTCTWMDKDAAQYLSDIAEIDPMELANEMFEAAEDLSGKDADDVFFEDFKSFTHGDIEFGVGQGSYMSAQNLEKAKELLVPYAYEALRKSELDMIFFMLTSVHDGGCTLICEGRGSSELIKEAFGVDVINKCAELNNIVSRKKQLIPAMLNAFRMK